MIRMVTVGRLRRLREDAEQARAHARETRGQAEARWGEHVREVWEMRARAQEAESDASILREHVGEIEAALKRARADLAERTERVGSLLRELETATATGLPLVVLLHWGEVHSVHASVHDAEDHAAAHGADPAGWVPGSARPAREVAWRILGTAVAGGGPCTP